MRKQCTECYHFSKGKCAKINTRVNATKHRHNCKNWITKEQYYARECGRSRNGYMDYFDILNILK